MDNIHPGMLPIMDKKYPMPGCMPPGVTPMPGVLPAAGMMPHMDCIHSVQPPTPDMMPVVEDESTLCYMENMHKHRAHLHEAEAAKLKAMQCLIKCK
ncbi:MAG: hypothetical protein FH760_00020 [Geosporobacter ferrireducens]|nr:hypothetical protein [Geosporobacter ferrireducens]